MPQQNLSPDTARELSSLALAASKKKAQSVHRAHAPSRASFAVRFFVVFSFATLVTFIWWASHAELEQMVRGQGKVIPDSANQVIQSLEAGIVSELLVKEGDVVKEGQVLLRLHDVQYSARYREDVARREILRSRLIRLQAEVSGVEGLVFPDDLAKARPDLVDSEKLLFKKRMEDLKTLEHFNTEKVQRLKQKVALVAPAIESGALSEISRIDLENQILELQGTLETTKSGFMRKAMEDLDEDRGKLATVEESIRATEDQLARATIKAPVEGVVNKLFVDSASRVIQGGQPIMEIVPASGGLVIEAKIAPLDIGFLTEGMPVKVRFTAYDFTVYGGLDGIVETLGVDTVKDDVRGGPTEVFYPIKVRTKERTLGKDGLTGQKLDLRPGMIAEVDILTGRRTVMDYLMNPIHRARRLAMRER